jgi:hypothetical protein
VTARRFRRLRQLAARLRPHVRGACRCPACDKTEQAARTKLGMPRLHPERIARELPAGQEELLAALASALWPDDEYTAITEEFWRKDRP